METRLERECGDLLALDGVRAVGDQAERPFAGVMVERPGAIFEQ